MSDNQHRQSETQERKWAKSFFQETPFELYMRQDSEKTLPQTISFLIERLNLSAGSIVFDQCCGFGSISIPMAAQGIRVVGVDLCEKFIAQARLKAEENRLPCEFFLGDAAVFVPPVACDAAINWWTSFGYSDSDATNKAFIDCVFASLKPGGAFCLDYPNFCHYLMNFPENEEYTYPSENGEIRVQRETRIELPIGLRRQLWRFTLPDGTEQLHDTHIKIYMPDTITSMLRQAGFAEIECFGDTTGAELSVKTARCIFLAKKVR